jgi:hypothetical protein
MFGLPQVTRVHRVRALVPDLAWELAFDEHADLGVFAEQLCGGLDRVLAVIGGIDTTAALVRCAVGHNKLIRMEKTCAYLAAVDDTVLLTEYIAALRDQFGDQARWTIFNHQLSEATGAWAAVLAEQGLLDPMEE